MADMILVEPLLITPAMLAYERGLGMSNLLTPDPREVAMDTTAGALWLIDIDFGQARVWDTVALINTNGATMATWGIDWGPVGGNYVSQTALAVAPLRVASEEVADATGPAFFRAPAPISGRYLRLRLTQPAGSVPLSIGALVVGLAWSPTWPRELGAGRPPIDTGVRTRTDGGGLVVVDGTLVSGFRWIFGDLGPSDLAKLWGLLRRLRTTRPFLLVEDPGASTAENIHWGTFVDLAAYERRDQDKSRWELRMEDWA